MHISTKKLKQIIIFANNSGRGLPVRFAARPRAVSDETAGECGEGLTAVFLACQFSYILYIIDT
jgi:hypothetical protein